jgi:hypothetical protein
MAGFTPDVIRILKDGKCYKVRQGKGDHEIWYSPLGGKNFPVDANIKSRHTANEVLKQTGVPKAF